jgi:hypothetical protein
VAIRADAAEEEFNTASVLDLLLVLVAFGVQIGGVPVEDVDVGRVYIYVGEKVLVHEAVVALRVLARNPDIFVLPEVRPPVEDHAAVRLGQAREGCGSPY